MRGALGWVGQVIAWSVMLFAGALIVLAVVVPRIAGATPYTILTGSMIPHYPPGTLVVARPIDPARLRVGDVVTYQLRSGEPEVVTHRIVAIGGSVGGSLAFRTQGDANNVADEAWVMPIQIRGRLWYAVPYVGRLNVLFTGHQHQWLVYGAAAVLGGYALVMFGGAACERLGHRPGKRRKEART